jgi:hypothetical protein
MYRMWLMHTWVTSVDDFNRKMFIFKVQPLVVAIIYCFLTCVNVTLQTFFLEKNMPMKAFLRLTSKLMGTAIDILIRFLLCCVYCGTGTVFLFYFNV